MVTDECVWNPIVANVLVRTALIVPSTYICRQWFCALFVIYKMPCLIVCEGWLACVPNQNCSSTRRFVFDQQSLYITLKWLLNIWKLHYQINKIMCHQCSMLNIWIIILFITQLVEVCHWLPWFKECRSRDNIVGNHWHWYRGWKHISAFDKFYRDYNTVLFVCSSMYC